jgi:hypothetical protein
VVLSGEGFPNSVGTKQLFSKQEELEDSDIGCRVSKFLAKNNITIL